MVMMVLAALGVLTYRAMLKKTELSLKIVREKRDTLFGHFRTLTEGMKELRINRVRREELQNRISKTIQDLNLHGLRAIQQYVFTDAISQFVFYAILGLLLFIIPFWNELPVETLTGYIFAALYLMGPIWGVLYALPNLQRGQIALESIETFKSSLSVEPESMSLYNERVIQWNALQMEDLVFSYTNDEDGDSSNGFVLGPIDFKLSPGQLVFVVGGNGCGKSTFVKLLCGLYTPKSGRILLDGRLITDQDRDRYRQYFSVVFSDFFLFDSIPRTANGFSDAQVNQYLKQLQLDKKVSITEGKLSTIALSQGQRRRLALLSAYLEDRPIYIFDEWAADQDPPYKEIFYKSLLPELRNKGKAVVVITHDDRYFGLGDRIVRFQ
jgi:putative ATP-binding cassette transporter